MAMATLSTPSTRSQYTYDQFIQQAQRDGLLSEFSDADLALAQRNPDAGMSILSYKRDYRNATTDADRELANLGAEGVRRSYGSYTGGNDGSQYYLEPLSPNMFEYADAPSFSGGSHSDTVEDLYGQMLDYGDFEYGPAPEYTSRWDDTMVDLVGQILNNPEFSYDPATDQLYQNYKQQYTREGQRATADALGIAAAASGGLPSSYAQTAANQQANYYAAQLTDMIPQLYQLAYDRYLNDYNMMISDLGVVQGMEESDRDLYLTDLNQYNTDREFAYGNWLDRTICSPTTCKPVRTSTPTSSTAISPSSSSTTPTATSPMDSFSTKSTTRRRTSRLSSAWRSWARSTATTAGSKTWVSSSRRSRSAAAARDICPRRLARTRRTAARRADSRRHRARQTPISCSTP